MEKNPCKEIDLTHLVPAYKPDADDEFLNQQWRIMERAQDEYPHIEMGWFGFVLMIFQRT